ncbi:hypothetical protein FOL47_001964 [Perkinsus chesapeaki]|uniref:Large ribosomal subunit protein uL4m n=1 Tax=Perkinsus chesapeaki TaxID=330153 RepID=A0A7J6N0F9_PERCH|nr:hypothetical protein FOL47_001964 [Perkinsus chesapeaki]
MISTLGAGPRRIPSHVLRIGTNAGFTVTASGMPMAPPEPEPGASIHDPPVVRRPGELADLRTVLRNWWSFPAVGFNAILEMPVYKFEVTCPVSGEPAASDEPPEEIGSIIGSLMGVQERGCMAGYQQDMQLFKWEWPGSNKKARSHKNIGKSRMGRRKAPGKYDGVFSIPQRPREWRQGELKRRVWKSLKMMLSAKFAQGEITVVDSFNVGTHKTRHVAAHLRRILGRHCNSALLVHVGNSDVNDNFRWGTAHIAQVRREDVEGVSTYNLLKYRQIVITEQALHKLIAEINNYPKKRGWLPKNATPDGRPAPVPQKVPGWVSEWAAKKQRLKDSELRQRDYFMEFKKWKWSTKLYGALKVPRFDPLAGFRVKDFSILEHPYSEMRGQRAKWQKFEQQEVYYDDEPIETDFNDPADLEETRGMLEHSEAAVIDLSVRNSEVFLQSKKDVQSLGEAMWSAKSTPNSYFVDLNDAPNYDFGGEDGADSEAEASDGEGDEGYRPGELDQGQSPPRQAFYPPPDACVMPPPMPLQQPPPMPWQQQPQQQPPYGYMAPPPHQQQQQQQFPSQVPPMPYAGPPPPYPQPPPGYTPQQPPYAGPPVQGGFMAPPPPPQQQQQPQQIPPPVPVEEKFSKELQTIADKYHLPDTTASLSPQLAARYGAIIVSLAGGVPASDDAIRDAAQWALENRQQTSAIARSLLRSMRTPKDGHHAMSMLFVVHEVLQQTSGPQGVVVRVLLKNYLPWMCRAAFAACYNRNSRKPGTDLTPQQRNVTRLIQIWKDQDVITVDEARDFEKLATEEHAFAKPPPEPPLLLPSMIYGGLHSDRKSSSSYKDSRSRYERAVSSEKSDPKAAAEAAAAAAKAKPKPPPPLQGFYSDRPATAENVSVGVMASLVKASGRRAREQQVAVVPYTPIDPVVLAMVPQYLSGEPRPSERAVALIESLIPLKDDDAGYQSESSRSSSSSSSRSSSRSRHEAEPPSKVPRRSNFSDAPPSIADFNTSDPLEAFRARAKTKYVNMCEHNRIATRAAIERIAHEGE